MLRESRAVSWYCPSTDYTFEIELGHPFLSFHKEFDLSCSAKGSIIYVYETKGKFWPLNYKWEGKGGIIDFRKRIEARGIVGDAVCTKYPNLWE